MKLVYITMLAVGLASSAFADHRDSDHENGYYSDSLENDLENLVYAAQGEEQEARYARNVILAQKYARMADLASRMASNVSELNSGNVYDPERYFENLRVKMHDIEQIARGIQRLPYEISDLIIQIRDGVDELTEGGGGHIEFPPEHGGGRVGLFQAQCDVTMITSSTLTLTVSGSGRTANAAIEAAQDSAERQCRANRARCHFGQCDVQRLR